MTKDSNTRRNQPKVSLPLWGVALLALFIAVLIIGSTIWLFNTVQGIASTLDTTAPEFVPGDGGAGTENIWNLDDPLVTPAAEEGGVGAALSPDVLRPWSGKERVSILIMGIDLRCDEEGPTHTDTMMVLTMDPDGLSAAAHTLQREIWL